METLKKMGNWFDWFCPPPSLYKQYCIKSNMSAGRCFNICYCWNKMICLFIPLHSSNICMCRSILYIFIPSNTAPLQGKGIKGNGNLPLVWRGILHWIRAWVSGCEMNHVSEEPGLLREPRHRFAALRCVCVLQRSFQAGSWLPPEISVSHYVIKPTQIILIFCSQNICREITFFLKVFHSEDAL